MPWALSPERFAVATNHFGLGCCGASSKSRNAENRKLSEQPVQRKLFELFKKYYWQRKHLKAAECFVLFGQGSGKGTLFSVY